MVNLFETAQYFIKVGVFTINSVAHHDMVDLNPVLDLETMCHIMLWLFC